jgi:hypothetical protein
MKTIEMIARSVRSSRAFTNGPAQTAVSPFDCCAFYLTILTLIGSLTVLFATATVHAQDVPGRGTEQGSAINATGWWSLESAASAASPRFLLSVAGLPDFHAFDAVKTSTAGSVTIPARDQTDEYLANMSEIGSLAPGSLLSIIQTGYAQWEANLADTETPTSVNGTMVYPLFQINYANGSLPVALYNSPLLGSSDTRW